MVVNSALLLVSAVFFLAMTAIFYLGAWIAIISQQKIRRDTSRRRGLSLLFVSLLLAPLIAGVLTVGGAFLRHSHAPDLVHHSLYCADIAHLLTVSEGKIPVFAGYTIEGAAWLLLLWGIAQGFRLIFVTVTLERELRPFMKSPSVKLQNVLDNARSGDNLGHLRFYEADIPMSRSCLLGVQRVCCVLATELVAVSTDEELAAVVLHEINHYRAGDVWRTLLIGFINCVFFYLRPVRLLSRLWREEAELACDAATVARTGNPLALASAILRVQGQPVQANPLPTVALGFAEEAACSPHKRIERLLAYAEQAVVPPAETLPSRLWQWTITVAFAGIGLLLLLTPQALCTAHCSLEAIARSLH